MSRVGAIVLAPVRFGAAVLASTGAAVRGSAGMIFNRGRSFGGLVVSRARIDYRSEVGDPATNSIVGAVVGWLARNFPEAPVRIVREGTTESLYPPAATGPGYMLRLLERPNEWYSGVLQWRATLIDWIVRGNAYWLKLRSPAGRVIALWWIPERMIEPRWPDDDSRVFIGWYEYKVDGVVYRLDPRDVVHFRNGLDPLNPRKGLSRLASLFREIFTDEEAAAFTASLLRNLGVPGVVITPSNTTGSTAIRSDPGNTPEAMKAKWMETFGGEHRGEPAVFSIPTDVKVLSFNPQQMELKSLRRIPEERISAVLGVPAGVAQLGAGLDRNTFTNYGEANVAAYTQGVVPDQRLFAAELEVQLLPEFASESEMADADVWFDWTRASAMQAATDAIWKRVSDAAIRGLQTRADFLRAIGQSPARDGADDVYIFPNNYLVLPVGQLPAGNAPAPVPGPRGGRPPKAPTPPPADSVPPGAELLTVPLEAAAPPSNGLHPEEVVAA